MHLTAKNVLHGLAIFFTPIWVQAQPEPSWTQLGGPHRNFHVDAGPLANTWAENGPTELWRRPLGEGYSSLIVDGTLIVTMYREGDQEIVVGLDANTGETRWQHRYRAPLAHNGYVDIWLNAAGPGPYSTPLIAHNAVFAVGIDGKFHALSRDTGEPLWTLDLVARFGLEEYNAFASSPLAYQETIILPLGGSSNGVVAFDATTGEISWESIAFPTAPGSPLLITVDGQEQLVVVGQQKLVGLDPVDGHLLWRHPHENELGLNLSMPVWGNDGQLFISSAYDGGSRMIQLSQIDGRTTADETWSTNRMRMHFTNALRVGELIIGSSGDFGPALVTALNADTGEERWRHRGFARAHLIRSNDTFVIADEDGDIALATMTEEGLQVSARHQLLTANAWTPPTLVGDRLYLRDRKHIVAVDLRAR